MKLFPTHSHAPCSPGFVVPILHNGCCIQNPYLNFLDRVQAHPACRMAAQKAPEYPVFTCFSLEKYAAAQITYARFPAAGSAISGAPLPECLKILFFTITQGTTAAISHELKQFRRSCSAPSPGLNRLLLRGPCRATDEFLLAATA